MIYKTDYKKEIKEIETEFNKNDLTRLGETEDDIKPKDFKIKRQIVLKNMYEELLRIEEINNKLQNGEIEDRQDYEENREPLSIEKTEEFKILLSWGGGEDGFKLRFKDKELINGVYYMADWGEYEEINLSSEEAQEVFNFYLYGEYPENIN